MVVKLLSDPTYFPIEFRRWLEDFFSNSDIEISQSQIVGGGAGGGSTNPTLLPAGIVLPYAGSTFGKDCLPCNGARISRTDYKELFDAIGVTWGAPDADTFRVPDLRDRALYGVGAVVSIGSTDGKDLGNRGGPFHHHSFSGNTAARGQHKHSVSALTADYGGYQGSFEPPFPIGRQANIDTNTVGDHTHPFSGDTTGGYDLDKPAYAGISYVITTGRASAA